MTKVIIAPFQIIGISVRTTNENEQAAKDIPKLWEQFVENDILSKIPNKVSNDIFSIYTNYESDHTKAYDTILGCRVTTLETVPDGLVSQSFNGGTYAKFTAKGDLTKGIIYNTWVDIWNTPLNRLYTADFEIYEAKAKNPKTAEVDIFVAIISE